MCVAAERFAARPVCSLRDTRWWAGVDKIREQEKLEARKMLENGDKSHLPKRSEGVHALLGGIFELKIERFYAKQTNLLASSVLFRTWQIRPPHPCLPVDRGAWLL